MLFVWDPTKAECNLAKHGIAFEQAWEFDWAGTGLVVLTVSVVRPRSAFCMAVSVRWFSPTDPMAFG